MRGFRNSCILMLFLAVKLQNVACYCREPEPCNPSLVPALDGIISECEATFPLTGATDQASCPEGTELATNLTSACFCHLVSRDPTLAVDTLDSDGTTWLHLVADEGDYQMAKCLIDNCADANATLTTANNVPLFRAVRNSEAEGSCVVAVLSQRGADVDLKDASSRSPLAISASRRFENVRTLEVLLDAGADINSRTSFNATAAHSAAQAGRASSLRLLNERGIDLAAVNVGGQTALQLAATARTLSRESVEALLRPGDPSLDIPFPDQGGSTPLMYMTFRQEAELVRLLIEAGADVDKPDDSGKTPLWQAIRSGNEEIAAMLRAAGAAEPSN